MSTQESSKGTLKFVLFGIPVEIRPSIWVVLALLGGAFRINDGSDLKEVLIFVAAGLLCILAHEMGHALTGLKFTGVAPRVTLAMMGGMTELTVLPPTRAQYILHVLAGPLTGLVPGLVAALLLGLQCENIGAGFTLMLFSPFGAEALMPNDHQIALTIALESNLITLPTLHIYATFMLISVWWCIFNLLPILPMDGGHLLSSSTNNLKLTSLVGMSLAGLLTMVSIVSGMWFTMMLMGYFAYINWQVYQEVRKHY
ncbi:MAG: hypothetical protein IKZ13_08780 [Akkermansia sp.]|nr:hypothetical protein [Akkermansia sp.]